MSLYQAERLSIIPSFLGQFTGVGLVLCGIPYREVNTHSFHVSTTTLFTVDMSSIPYSSPRCKMLRGLATVLVLPFSFDGHWCTH